MDNLKGKFVKYQSGLRENIFVEAHSLHNYVNFLNAIKNVLDGGLDMHYLRDLILESLITKTKEGYKKIDIENYEAFYYKVPIELKITQIDIHLNIGMKLKFKNKQDYELNADMFKSLFTYCKNDKTLEIVLQNLEARYSIYFYDLNLLEMGFTPVEKEIYYNV